MLNSYKNLNLFFSLDFVLFHLDPIKYHSHMYGCDYGDQDFVKKIDLTFESASTKHKCQTLLNSLSITQQKTIFSLISSKDSIDSISTNFIKSLDFSQKNQIRELLQHLKIVQSKRDELVKLVQSFPLDKKNLLTEIIISVSDFKLRSKILCESISEEFLDELDQLFFNKYNEIIDPLYLKEKKKFLSI